MKEQELRETLCVMLRLFYAKDWVSGTGGGMCATGDDGMLRVAPTGVHKELVRPEDFFVIDPQTCGVVTPSENQKLKPSECSPIFAAIVRVRGAGSVVHSHALSAVIAADLGETGLAIRRLEMLKGIRGLSNEDVHEVPIIDNTAREPELTGGVEMVLEKHPDVFAILVRDHGAYIWGADVWEAKRHAEVYHFLFEAARARS